MKLHPIFQLDLDQCTQRVKHVLDNLLYDANKTRTEFITPEHLLFEILHQNEFSIFLRTHHLNVQEFYRELSEYLDSLDTVPKKQKYIATCSCAFDELIEHINNEAKEVPELDFFPITILNLLAHMYDLNDSMAQYLLKKYVGESIQDWYNELYPFYEGDITELLHEDEDEEFEEIDDDIDNEAEDTSIADGFPEIPGLPEDIRAKLAKAIKNGSSLEIDVAKGSPNGPIIHSDIVRIDPNMSKEEIMEKMMGSARRLMGALHNLESHVKGNKEEPQQRRKEPWEQYVTNINETFRMHNPLIGREEELQRTIRVLCRKDKNNPLHIGEAGVGKTSLIYGLAEKIVNGDVPEVLQDYTIFMIDMGSIVAGASYHGEFERRMKEILEGAKRFGKSILYIDEVHTITSAGGGNGSIDAANLLKPYLEDGSLKFIGSTTYQEYNKSIANNKAISRRFQQIDVKEPSIEETIQIIEGLIDRYQSHHCVKYDKAAIRYAVEKSNSLISDRFLPDKAIDLIDEAGAYRQLHPLLDKNGNPKQKRYQKVDTKLVAHIISDVCKINAKALTAEDNSSLKDLAQRISNDIYGQDEAIKHVVRSVQMAKAGLTDPNKPLASLLFVGPTGVGKTEVCRVLAQQLGIELVRFDMSEYTEKHTVSKLIGSPAGYIGYDEGGLLTDAVRKTPNCVLLLDEIEKAHSDIYNILLQVMDYARLTDNKGNKADFKNVILVMTSNAGAQYAAQAGIGFNGGQSKGEAMMTTVKKTFKPEFLNRLSGTVVFNDMDEHMATLILDKKLRELQQRLDSKAVTLKLTKEAKAFLLEKGYTKQYGAREMERVIQHHLTPLLMEAILFGKLKKGGEALVTKQGDELIIANN